MKVLILNGSAHASGCTARALKELEKTLNEEGIETENILVGNQHHLLPQIWEQFHLRHH